MLFLYARAQSWRVPYYLSGMIGIIVAALAITTMKEPKRTVISEDSEQEPNEATKTAADAANDSAEKEVSIWKVLFQPKILILCIAASIRHTGE